MLREKIVNIITGEETFRDYTAEEMVEVEKEQLQAKAKAEAELKAAADKAALLAKLGITADEAKLLLS